MFQINDTVMYGNSGVCRVEDIRWEQFNSDSAVLYYVLKPVYESHSTIYCPVNSDKIKIRKLLSLEEIDEFIQMMPDVDTVWIENDQLRKEKYIDILKRSDHKELIMLLKTLHMKREEKEKFGRKFHSSDERIMKEAEHILHGEFAHVLHIQQEDVVDFIMGKLNGAGVEKDTESQ